MSLPEILERISQLRSHSGRVLIGIDGYGGAGKSTVARSIVRDCDGAQHIELDWFHLPQAEIVGDARFDLSRLKSEVLEPFLAGASRVSFGRYNWGYLSHRPDGLEAASLDLQGVSLLVIEGCMAFHPQLEQFFQFKIWVGADPDEAHARGARRDVEQYRLEEKTVRAAWREWNAWEKRCLRRDDRRKRADFVL